MSHKQAADLRRCRFPSWAKTITLRTGLKSCSETVSSGLSPVEQDGWMDGQMDRLCDGWTNGWMVCWMDGWMEVNKWEQLSWWQLQERLLGLVSHTRVKEKKKSLHFLTFMTTSCKLWDVKKFTLSAWNENKFSIPCSSSLRCFLHLHSSSAFAMRRNTTSRPFTGGTDLCWFFFYFPLIHYIFNLLLSSAAAFGVKDYRGQIVNAGRLDLQREMRV